MINTITLVGRLTDTPELKIFDNGSQVVHFKLAVNGYKNDETLFINCVAWNKLADSINRYVDKGHLLGVCGRLTQRTYETSEGDKRTLFEVNCNDVEFLQPKEKEPEQTPEQKGIYKREDIDKKSKDFVDDDLPW